MPGYPLALLAITDRSPLVTYELFSANLTVKPLANGELHESSSLLKVGRERFSCCILR